MPAPAAQVVPGGGQGRKKGFVVGVYVHHRHTPRNRPPQQGFGMAQGFGHRHDQHRLARKPVQVHRAVGRHHNAPGGVDLGRGQHVAGPVGAVGLHLQGNPHGGRLAFQGLRRHEGVGHPHGAGGHCQHLAGAFFRVPGGGLACRGGGLPVGNDLQKGFWGPGFQQLCAEIRVHQKACQIGQHRHMQVGVGVRHRNLKQQPHRGAVQCPVVQVFAQGHGGQGGFGHPGALGVGNGHPAAHTGGTLGFPVQHFPLIAGGVAQAAPVVQQGGHGVDGSGLVGHFGPQHDSLRAQQFGDAHGSVFLFRVLFTKTAALPQERGRR